VFDAAKKLNEIKGFKGLDRYFKQIAQSARTNKAKEDSNVDDFLGAININVNNIPSNGFDGFYDLEGRTEKSNVEGKIRLRLNLATREDRGQLDDQVFIELKQHGQLLEIFIDYEISKFKGNNDKWKGCLSREAETVLHQHAIQGDLTEIQLAIW
jgi:BAI1-associated protein 3